MMFTAGCFASSRCKTLEPEDLSDRMRAEVRFIAGYDGSAGNLRGLTGGAVVCSSDQSSW